MMGFQDDTEAPAPRALFRCDRCTETFSVQTDDAEGMVRRAAESGVRPTAVHSCIDGLGLATLIGTSSRVRTAADMLAALQARDADERPRRMVGPDRGKAA